MVPAAGAALIRVATYPHDLTLPAWPDLASGQPRHWQRWLGAVWELPGFADAVTVATPQLASQVRRAVAGGPVPVKRLRRLVESVARYLLRWTTRATPFGTFAGVAPMRFGAHAAVRVGQAHHALTRPDGLFIHGYADQAERDLTLLRTVAVVTNSLGYQRGHWWVLPCARIEGERRWDIEVHLTRAVKAAIHEARHPIGFAELATKITDPTNPDPTNIDPTNIAAAQRLLADLVRLGVLCSALRPAMTVTDPAAYAIGHYRLPPPGRQVAVDLRADVAVTLPPAVPREAGRAASTLVAVAPGMPGWVQYHHAFIDRWGPGAAVPLRQVLNVLGFPAGYRGSTRRAPAVFTARDRFLGQLAQRSAMNGAAEVVLDDALIDRLRGDDDRPPVPHTELRFTLAADTLHDLERGAFTLTVLSGSRHAGVAAGRFLHLLTPAERAAFQQVYRDLPTALPDAATVQLSGPPLDAHLATVARAPELLPILPVGEFHPAPAWTVDDLAVTGDGQRLWLLSQTSGQPVEALLFNSVLPALQQPLTRFLNEIWAAWNAPCSRFDWGHAASLPFLPRVRRGRTILHPARWIIDLTTLPTHTTAWNQWREAWQRHRHQHHIPQHVLVGDDDVRLRLDLDDNTHQAILREHLHRHPHTVITEAPGPAGWIDNRPAELLLTLTHTPPAARPPRQARPVRTLTHRPGAAPWLQAHLYGRAEDILADLATRPDGHLPAGWWFLRYPHPEPHLRLRIPIPDRFADIAARLADWVRDLHNNGLVHDYNLHPYRPETRHGTGATRTAAHEVFAADSHTVLSRLDGDRQATTTAGMIAIAEGFTGHGLRWLAIHVPQRVGPRMNPTQLDLAGIPLHDKRLTTALATYRALAERDGLDTDQVLADLLHLHHARMIGVDTTSEQHCLRLARAIAHTAHARRTP